MGFFNFRVSFSLEHLVSVFIDLHCMLLLQGRKGFGSIFVFAAGNGGRAGDSCAFNGLVNSIYTIAISGVKKDGSLPHWGEHCPGVLAVTYSKGRFYILDETKVVSVSYYVVKMVYCMHLYFTVG